MSIKAAMSNRTDEPFFLADAKGDMWTWQFGGSADGSSWKKLVPYTGISIKDFYSQAEAVETAARVTAIGKPQVSHGGGERPWRLMFSFRMTTADMKDWQVTA